MKCKVGIFAGSFDPVHAGHIGFALQAIRDAGLDEVVFLPERRPRGKAGAEHFGHRVAMLKRALKPYKNLSVLELVDARFDVKRTLPHLKAALPAELVLLVGSDVVKYIPEWPGAKDLLRQMDLIVGVRAGQCPEAVQLCVEFWPVKPNRLTVIPSHAAEVSSSRIREAWQRGQTAAGALNSAMRYARANWLYASVSFTNIRTRS